MPAPQVKKTASADAAAPKAKGMRSSTASGTSTPIPPSATEDASAATTSGRPDKAAFDAEQDKIKKDIDATQTKLNALKDKINPATKGSAGNDRRSELRAELDTLRGQQAGSKTSRSNIFEELKTTQESIQNKVKAIQAAKAKVPFKTVEEVDAHIKAQEKQVESGNLTLAGEKRALADISTAKRNRRVVESFEADQEAIETARRTADDLRKQLDDPESKAASDRYEAVKAELDTLKKEQDDAYAGRNKLFAERDLLQAALNTLFNSKRDSAAQFREANDRFYAKVSEDRARRAERARAERHIADQEKKMEIAERLREEAAMPAYQAQIDDCQTLIDYFAGKNNGNVTFASSIPGTLFPRKDVAGVAKLELRKVEDEPQGLVVRKKKGEEEQESYFAAKGKKGKKAPVKANGPSEEPAAPAATSSSQLILPLPTLSALLSLSIPPPAASSDVPRVVEDLKTKKAWFQANQERVTTENITKAEADIKRLTKSDGKDVPTPLTADVTPVNGGGERPAEPAPTPQISDAPVPSVPVATSEVDEKLEEVQEEAESS